MFGIWSLISSGNSLSSGVSSLFLGEGVWAIFGIESADTGAGKGCGWITGGSIGCLVALTTILCCSVSLAGGFEWVFCWISLLFSFGGGSADCDAAGMAVGCMVAAL